MWRPCLDYESHATGLDRNELGALLVAAVLGPAAEHALVSLLALNGLRVSEAVGADIEALGTERRHRTLVVTRKGGKVVTILLALRTARAIDLAIGEHCEGPIFLDPGGRRLDRHGAGRTGPARRDRQECGPHTPRHADPERTAIREALALGNAVYDRHTAMGISVAQVALRAGMTADEIDCIEEGGTELTVTLLRRLAAPLEADVRISSGDELGSVEFEAHAAWPSTRSQRSPESGAR